MSDLRVILIGGTSNSGKSSLGEYLAARLGWRYRPTDLLARHPGRPWRPEPETVPPHVAVHYLTLTVDQLVDDVLRYYKRLWPTIERIVTTHATDEAAGDLVMEGSALWPETVATLNLDAVAAVWLTASNGLLQARIYRESRFAEASPERQLLIRKFVERTQRYNDLMIEAVGRLGLPSINVEATASLDELADACLRLARR
jgi:2-phosphoglycerate kinase